MGPRARDERGQATLEFVLVLPVLVLGLLAVVQVARLAAVDLAVGHASHQAARAAAVDPHPDAARAAARAASPELDPSRLQVALGGAGRGRGELVTVQVTYRAEANVPVVGRLVGGVTLTSQAAARIE